MNRSMRNTLLAAGVLAALALAVTFCGKKEEAKDAVTPGEYASGKIMRVPLIAWGADLVAINANGRSARTLKGSYFEREGINVELFREDNFMKQVDLFIKGDIVYLRGTMGMMNMAVERLSASPATRPVLVFQHSWSAGGDALVVKPGIASVAQLKGKTVAIQKNGPHVDYYLKLLKDAGLSFDEVKTVWTKDLVGPQGDTPMAKLARPDVDAAFVIIPDALSLTSQGKVGTGAEDSVKGARILLSTKTASKIISDVYAVRKDYFDKNKEQVRKFVKALMASEEEVRDLFRTKSANEYKELLKIGGKLLLDDPNATTGVEGMYYDAEIAGYNGNVRFFAEPNYPRNYQVLTREIQDSLIGAGIMTRRIDLLTAGWNYAELKAGLRYGDAVPGERFDPAKAVSVAERLGGDRTLFMFEIYFKPNQDAFPVAQYKREFDRVINFASTYGGALITVEGHADPMSFLRKQSEGAGEVVLKRIKQSAKNLSYSRAQAVRDQIVRYAKEKGIALDATQFTILGHGIAAPKFSVPKTSEEWQQNMRVQFRIMQVEAEEEVFRPLK
ncbi:MAG TPA: ABC transporter substrate-binding protein [Spirochaetota bacterium]|nr:ABC transporter substrate-binding protein [Spirochaetota bacterium]